MLMLKKLTFSKCCRFRDLKIDGLSTDHQTYHINTLIKLGLVKKSENKLYTLTTLGKEYTNRIDDSTEQIENQGKRTVLVRVVQKQKRTMRYLVNKRKKQPFFDHIGFCTGKIREGETVFAAATRELLEETGLHADLYLIGVIHFIDYDSKGKFIRDVYFWTFNGYNPKGNLIKNNPKEGVINYWTTKQELTKEKTYPGFWDQNSRTSWLFIPQNPPTSQKLIFYEKVRAISDF
jgi:ADP-ribose pyrophosphatase YjhB (NUDIX family)